MKIRKLFGKDIEGNKTEALFLLNILNFEILEKLS